MEVRMVPREDGKETVEIKTNDTNTFVCIDLTINNVGDTFADCELYSKNDKAFYIQRQDFFAISCFKENFYYIQSNSYENLITIIDNMNYSITATAHYTDGSVPVTNLGNEYVEGQIKSGSISYSINNALSGYRNSFYGTLENKDELLSANIRTLTMTGKELINGTSITVPIPIGAFRTVFAYPSTLNDLESVIDVNGDVVLEDTIKDIKAIDGVLKVRVII